MSVNFNCYVNNVSTSSNNNQVKNNSKTTTKTTLVTTGLLAGAGITTAILTKGKSGGKIVESISKKLPELETRAKSIWGKWLFKCNVSKLIPLYTGVFTYNGSILCLGL